ncbi:MAG: NFACT family protein, partial [Euryarchaeota archaeon]|nr:NFACT family protein [Euryarchaeota archaeon]
MTMKTAMTGVDIAASVLELQRLVGTSVDKIHQQSPMEFRLRIGREDLLIEAGRRIHLTRYRRPAGGTHNFPMLLRKHLTGGRLIRVRQAGLDRIVELQVARGEAGATVVVEMLTPPNLLLLDGENHILRALTHRTYKDRSLRRGETYRPPPAKPDPRTLTPAALGKLLAGSSRDLVRTLATDLGLGGLYAEEVCLRAGLDKNLEAPRADPDKIREALRGLLDPLHRGPLRPRVLLQGGEMVDVVPLELESHRGMEARPYPTFQEALDDYFTHLASRPAEDPQAGLRRMLESQEKTAARLEAEAREADGMARRIYAHYPEVEEALREKRKQIVLDGDTVELDPRLGVEKNAARLYQRAKEARAKLQGARQAIEETRRRLEAPP